MATISQTIGTLHYHVAIQDLAAAAGYAARPRQLVAQCKRTPLGLGDRPNRPMACSIARMLER